MLKYPYHFNYRSCRLVLIIGSECCVEFKDGERMLLDRERVERVIETDTPGPARGVELLSDRLAAELRANGDLD